MDVDERACRELYTQLANTMGTKAADTLMSNLPPSGWDDMATKQDVADLATKQDVALVKQDVVLVRSDLANLAERMSLRLARVEARFEVRLAEQRSEWQQQLREQTRVIVFSVFASMAAFAGIVVATG